MLVKGVTEDLLYLVQFLGNHGRGNQIMDINELELISHITIIINDVVLQSHKACFMHHSHGPTCIIIHH